MRGNGLGKKMVELIKCNKIWKPVDESHKFWSNLGYEPKIL